MIIHVSFITIRTPICHLFHAWQHSLNVLFISIHRLYYIELRFHICALLSSKQLCSESDDEDED